VKLKNLVILTLIALVLTLSVTTMAEEHVVYSVYSRINMGHPGEKSKKDFFVNMGARHGVAIGSRLTVYRKLSTYDLLSKKLYRDMMIPIGFLKVIHTENFAAIARLEEMLPEDDLPHVTPGAVLVGDQVSLGGP